MVPMNPLLAGRAVKTSRTEHRPPHRAASAVIDDRVLLVRWHAGDARAGDILVRSHDPALATYLRGRTSAQEGEDLKQQVWLELARSRPAAVEISVRAYLFGIARHMLFRHCARQRRDPVRGPLTATLTDFATYLAWEIRGQQGPTDARALLDHLPNDVQRLLEARYIHELSTAELAARYAVPTGTIKSRLWHARKLLRTTMFSNRPSCPPSHPQNPATTAR
jgi:RNA polymerase sigma factor (sigma-70 family)